MSQIDLFDPQCFIFTEVAIMKMCIKLMLILMHY